MSLLFYTRHYSPRDMCQTALRVITIAELHSAIIYTWPTFGLLVSASLCSQVGSVSFFFFSEIPVRLRRSDPGHVTQRLCVPEICTKYKHGFAEHASVNQIKLSCQCYPSVLLLIWIAAPTGPSSCAGRPSLDSPVYLISTDEMYMWAMIYI